jgi:triosephosphate isomerase
MKSWNPRFAGVKSTVTPSSQSGGISRATSFWIVKSGNGVTATSQQAQDAHAFVRSLVAVLYGADTASRIRIQYGGSVKPNNASELMACPEIYGAVIGGAALEPQSFLENIRNGSGQ